MQAKIVKILKIKNCHLGFRTADSWLFRSWPSRLLLCGAHSTHVAQTSGPLTTGQNQRLKLLGFCVNINV